MVTPFARICCIVAAVFIACGADGPILIDPPDGSKTSPKGRCDVDVCVSSANEAKSWTFLNNRNMVFVNREEAIAVEWCSVACSQVGLDAYLLIIKIRTLEPLQHCISTACGYCYNYI